MASCLQSCRMLRNLTFDAVVCILCMPAKSLQSCLTLCNPMDCSPPGSSVQGTLQARILEWVAIPFSRGSSQPGIEPGSPAFQVVSLPSEPPGKPRVHIIGDQIRGDDSCPPPPQMPEPAGTPCSGVCRLLRASSHWKSHCGLRGNTCTYLKVGRPTSSLQLPSVRRQAVMFTITLSGLGLDSFPPAPLAPLM